MPAGFRYHFARANALSTRGLTVVLNLLWICFGLSEPKAYIVRNK